MRGQVQSILSVFDGSHTVLRIPVYQRNYDWSIRECGKLFDDLEEVIRTDRPKHFFGAIVGKPETNKLWVVIDGQQRLTTVSLLMLALVTSIRTGTINLEDDDGLADQILDDYLLGKSSGNKVKVKLKPVKDDAKAYQKLFGPEDDFIEDSTITANYRHFLKLLAETEFSAEQIWDAIWRLEVMILDLEDHDDPQRIFESLNSTGKALSEADKTRNFVLMGLDSDTQTEIYEDLWNPIEINVGYRTDWFIRWYLVTKTHRTPRESDVYEAFKAYANGSQVPIRSILEDMHVFSKINKDLESANTGFASVDKRLTRANLVLGDVSLPFLWPVIRDTKDGAISEADLLRVVEILESYTFRRILSGVAANSLNKIFATLYNELRKLYKEEHSYSDILIYLLRKRDGTSGRFPSDAEFREAVENRNVYNMRSVYQRYLFDVLENADSNDTRDIATGLEDGSLSIEHIMPRTLTADWRQELGPDAEEIHENWLNRIGNLTVTGYNSTYSNSSFQRKKSIDGGFDVSPFRLNQRLKESDTWGEEEMQNRTTELSDIALNYWTLPATEFTPPPVVLPMETMGTEQSFRGRTIASFSYGDAIQTVRTWGDLVEDLLKILVLDYRDALIAIAREGSTLLRVKAEVPNEEIGTRKWRKIDDALFVYVANGTDSKISFLRGVFEELNLDPDELVFRLTPTKEEESEDIEDIETKYGELTKFIYQFDEAAGAAVEETDLDAVIREFTSTFESFRHADPASVLGGKSVADFGAVDQASEEQILALITQQIDIAKIIGPTELRNAVTSGRMSSYLKRLQDLDSA